MVDKEAQSSGRQVVDPFRGNSARLAWSRPVNVGQLLDELKITLGDSVQVALYPPMDKEGNDLPVDEGNPITVFLSPSSVDIAKAKRTMGAHRPNPYYGLSPEEKRRVQIQEKVASGQDLSQAEMAEALKMAMGM